jgi:hypothetical protein
MRNRQDSTSAPSGQSQFRKTGCPGSGTHRFAARLPAEALFLIVVQPGLAEPSPVLGEAHDGAVPRLRMWQADGVTDAFVVDDAIRPAIGHAPAIGTDQAPSDAAVREVRRPRSSRGGSRKMLRPGIVALEYEFAVFSRLQPVEVVERPPVDVAQNQQDRKRVRTLGTEVECVVHFAERAKTNVVPVPPTELPGGLFGDKRIVEHLRRQRRLTLILALVELLDPAAEVIDALTPVGQRYTVRWHEVDDRHFNAVNAVPAVPGVEFTERSVGEDAEGCP